MITFGENKAYIYRMVKNLLIFILLAISPSLIAQDIIRVEVSGKIHVPKGEDAEGISVYNLSSKMGTVTDEDGSFKIAVAENDRLEIFALQYQSFKVVIDKGVIDQKRISIFVNPAVNQLEEVVVRPYDLSGNIRADIKKIPTYDVGKDWNLSYSAMEFDYNFTRDKQSEITGNAAEEALNEHHLTDGLNFIAILGGVGKMLFPNDKKLTKDELQRMNIKQSNNMQHRFSQEFIHDNFDIPWDKTSDFIFYAQENGLESNLLKPENEMLLMEFLMEKSKEYRMREKQ